MLCPITKLIPKKAWNSSKEMTKRLLFCDTYLSDSFSSSVEIHQSQWLSLAPQEGYLKDQPELISYYNMIAYTVSADMSCRCCPICFFFGDFLFFWEVFILIISIVVNRLSFIMYNSMRLIIISFSSSVTTNSISEVSKTLVNSCLWCLSTE